MAELVLRVNDVSIKYKVGDCQAIGLKEFIMRKLTHTYHVSEFSAVQHVSFEIYREDMLGIVGVNGSGKSTLLKAISGIMEPSEGSIEVYGKVAALLELGSGFDGDLTVKENTFLRGALLGYERSFITEKYQDIIEFAELTEFEDRPFRQLSSGMQARLAFAIASMVQPEILILDEVLSVGDGAFQKKSEQKMKNIITGGATTILVSHSTVQIREMCTKVLWLERGQQKMFGPADEVCDVYEEFLAQKNA